VVREPEIWKLLSGDDQEAQAGALRRSTLVAIGAASEEHPRGIDEHRVFFDRHLDLIELPESRAADDNAVFVVHRAATRIREDAKGYRRLAVGTSRFPAQHAAADRVNSDERVDPASHISHQKQNGRVRMDTERQSQVIDATETLLTRNVLDAIDLGSVDRQGCCRQIAQLCDSAVRDIYDGLVPPEPLPCQRSDDQDNGHARDRDDRARALTHRS
jgi:hypothetical protein